MATTTNYGWTTPNDTDLVKDGAAAIRTLGSSIDTTVFANAGAGIAKTIVDAKGDIIAATAADTVARLAVGTNGQVLTAASGQATGLQWATPAAAGGYTLLSTTTLSGTSTVISSINQTYRDLVFIGYGITWSANLSFKINPNSTESISVGVGTQVTGGTLQNIGTTQIHPFSDATIASNSGNGFYLLFNNYATTTRKPFQYYGNHAAGSPAEQNRANIGGAVTQASAITSMQFTSQSGTASFTAGTILMYGVN